MYFASFLLYEILSKNIKKNLKMAKMSFRSLNFTHFLAFFMLFWKIVIKYKKIKFFLRKFHILWPTTQKSTLRSQNSTEAMNIELNIITLNAFFSIFIGKNKKIILWKYQVFTSRNQISNSIDTSKKYFPPPSGLDPWSVAWYI